MRRERILSVLCRRPLVVAAFDRDFVRNAGALAALVRPRPKAAVLVQLGWERETAARADALAGAVAGFRELVPGARVVVLCNSPRECDALGARDVETVFANHNAFIDERRFLPVKAVKRYDAVYTARLTPFKRHSLLPPALAPRLLCIGCGFPPDERDYAESIRARFPDATWIERFPGACISSLLARARCGLALSAAEGACFASSEYLLCGLPVVDTPALGGRDALYPPEFVASVEAAPEAVAADC
ncbi:MAG: glycosyltransferase, partial [Kiritimatiellae bacterium]|nr:glycosyltransferase [Kiritimatiellia bacterium]